MASSSESHGTHDLNAATNPMTLNKEGLDAAHAAYAKTTGGMLEGHPMANAITAYLAAVSNSEERRRRAAGPSEVVWPMADPLKKYKDAAQTAPDGLAERLVKRLLEKRTINLADIVRMRVLLLDEYSVLHHEAATFIQTLQRERDEARKNAGKLHDYANMRDMQIVDFRGTLEELVDSLTPAEHASGRDPAYGDVVRNLGKQIGFGALMSCASTEWRLWLEENGYPVGSEFVSGPCRSVLQSDLARARLLLKEGGE